MKKVDWWVKERERERESARERKRDVCKYYTHTNVLTHLRRMGSGAGV